MPTALPQLARTIIPQKTVVLFGAGSAVPSVAATANQLASKISQKFKLEDGEFLLDEISGIVEACLLYTSPSPRDRG